MTHIIAPESPTPRVPLALPVLRDLLIALSLTAHSGPASAADEWPAFRGPAGDGRADAARIPVNWDDSQNVAWQTPIHGRAWSSPVVSGNDIWLTTATEDGSVLSVLCVDLDSGNIRLDRKVLTLITRPTSALSTPTPPAPR